MTIAWVLCSFLLVLAIAAVIVGRWAPHGPPEDGDPGDAGDDGGGGGGGPGRDRPTGPAPGVRDEPSWWAEFEREFAAYAARRAPAPGGVTRTAAPPPPRG